MQRRGETTRKRYCAALSTPVNAAFFVVGLFGYRMRM
jgi:hypothetical protein